MLIGPLRTMVEAALPDLTSGEWELLEGDGYVDEVDLGAVEAGTEIEYLVDRVKLIRQATQQHPDRPRADGTADAEALAQRASTRAEALSLLFASDAGRHGDVLAFRDEVLSGELLAIEQVGEWIEQGARDGEPIRPRKLLEYGMPGGWLQAIPTSSNLERLRVLSESLAARYGWQPAQATNFVLTDTVPLVAAIRARTHRRLPVAAASRIVLEIDPTATPREVAERFARERARVIQGRPRKMSEKHLRLAIFADQHNGGTWAERKDAWNKINPSWRYSEASNFQRDAATATRRLLEPSIR